MAETPSLSHLTSIQNDTSAVATINSNMDAITTAFEDCLSLNGNTPNQMNASLDMNGNAILNVSNISVTGAGGTGTVNGPGTTAVNDVALWNNNSGTLLKDVTPVTFTQSLLSQFTSSQQGVAPASGGGTTNFLRADGTWTAPSGAGVSGPVSSTVGHYAKWNNTAGTLLKDDVILAADMPTFVASGASHAKGAVPDPGGSAGTTKFLREDATFALPTTMTSASLLSTTTLGTPSSNTGILSLANAGTGTTSTIQENSDGSLSVVSGNAVLHHGAADAAAPVAQTIVAQSVVAGTTNTAGANLTVKGSAGTGTGAGGQIIVQTVPASTTGSTQNTAATALTLTAPAVSQQPSVVVGNQAVATTATDGFLYIPGGAGAPTGVPTTFTGRYPLYWNTTNKKLYIYDGGWLGGTAPGVWTV